MIVIEIHNHTELARSRSFLARALGGLAPGWIRRQVERRVAELLESALAERGVEATVRIRAQREPDTGEPTGDGAQRGAEP